MEKKRYIVFWGGGGDYVLMPLRIPETTTSHKVFTNYWEAYGVWRRCLAVNDPIKANKLRLEKK